MKLRSNVHPARVGMIDIVPLINVVLLLLLFFLITSTFVLQSGIKVDLPQVVPLSGTSTRYIIAITAQDPPQIFFNDQWQTRSDLAQQLHRIARREANASVVIKADSRVPSGFITDILALTISEGLSVVIATQPPPAPHP